MPRSRHRTGHRYRQARRQMFADRGTICHLCGHDGATDADHLVPISLDPDQPVDPDLMRPAHGVTGCPTCHRRCNQSRGNKMTFPQLNTSEDW